MYNHRQSFAMAASASSSAEPFPWTTYYGPPYAPSQTTDQHSALHFNNGPQTLHNASYQPLGPENSSYQPAGPFNGNKRTVIRVRYEKGEEDIIRSMMSAIPPATPKQVAQRLGGHHKASSISLKWRRMSGRYGDPHRAGKKRCRQANKNDGEAEGGSPSDHLSLSTPQL